MGLFDKLESKLEQGVNGAFARAFKSEVQPVEIASGIRRAMDDRAASVGKGKRPIVPNLFTVELSPTDYDRLCEWGDELDDELVASAQEHADEQRYQPGGPLTIVLVESDTLETGVFRLRPATAKAADVIAHQRQHPRTRHDDAASADSHASHGASVADEYDSTSRADAYGRDSDERGSASARRTETGRVGVGTHPNAAPGVPTPATSGRSFSTRIKDYLLGGTSEPDAGQDRPHDASSVDDSAAYDERAYDEQNHDEHAYADDEWHDGWDDEYADHTTRAADDDEAEARAATRRSDARPVSVEPHDSASSSKGSARLPRRPGVAGQSTASLDAASRDAAFYDAAPGTHDAYADDVRPGHENASGSRTRDARVDDSRYEDSRYDDDHDIDGDYPDDAYSDAAFSNADFSDDYADGHTNSHASLHDVQGDDYAGSPAYAAPRPHAPERPAARRHAWDDDDSDYGDPTGYEPAPAPAQRHQPRAMTPRERPWLKIEGQRYPLLGAITVLGRDDDADIVVDDPGVSRRHSEIRITHDGPHLVMSVRDLGSTNGTYVNGDLIDSAHVHDGDRLTLGRTPMTIHLGDRP